MSDRPQPEKGPRPPRGDHAQGERIDAEAPERVASAESRAHGTHGKGGEPESDATDHDNHVVEAVVRFAFDGLRARP